MMGIQGLYKTKKSWGGCHHLLLVYDASKLNTVYVVKSPVLGLQWAPEYSVLVPSVQVLHAQADIISQWKMGI